MTRRSPGGSACYRPFGAAAGSGLWAAGFTLYSLSVARFSIKSGGTMQQARRPVVIVTGASSGLSSKANNPVRAARLWGLSAARLGLDAV